MLDLAIKTSPIDQSYNRFCSELEKAIKMTFTGENYINNNRLSKEQYLLRNAVQSFANKLYVQKSIFGKRLKKESYYLNLFLNNSFSFILCI